MRSKGITLIESLTCVAIMGVVAAIAFPVFGSVKRKSLETQCASNLRQLWLAHELYRQDCGGGAAQGRPHEMGLPNDQAHAELWSRVKVRCPFFDPKLIYSGYYYHPGGDTEQMAKLWETDVAKFGDRTMLYSNWGHNDPKDLERTLFPKLGIGINLAGQLQTRRATGRLGTQAWWHNEETAR